VSVVAAAGAEDGVGEGEVHAAALDGDGAVVAAVVVVVAAAVAGVEVAAAEQSGRVPALFCSCSCCRRHPRRAGHPRAWPSYVS